MLEVAAEISSKCQELDRALGIMPHRDAEFYESLKLHFEAKGTLSTGQLYYFEKLYGKYNMSALLESKKWEDSYSEEHRSIALKCATYYDRQFPRYYGNLVDRVLEDPAGHILGEREFNKMCDNKYSKKILLAYATAPKFSPGDLAQIRVNNRVDIANCRDDLAPITARLRLILRDRVCMILEVDALPITRPAKGARVYKVLVTNEARPIFAHESDLKNVRRKKK